MTLKMSDLGRSGDSGARLNVLLLNTKPHNPNYYIVVGIEEALRSIGSVGKVQKANYKDVVQHARSGEYDLLLAVDGENIVVEIMERLRAFVPVMALWAFEDPYERSRTAAVASLFDLVFTNDSGSVEFYPPGAQHLSLAAVPTIDERRVRKDDDSYEYDLSFVGSAWPNRVRFLRRLLKQMPTLKTRIVLAYNPYLPRAYLDMPDSSYVGAVSHYDFVEIANRSRINLTLHRDFSGDGQNTRALDPGPRIFETALAGGFQLIDAAETRLSDVYKAGSEVETFGSFEECIDKIKEALADPGARIAKVVAGQSRTKRAHLYSHRVAKILDGARATRNAKRSAPVVTTTTARSKPRLLFVTHNTIAGGNFGGVEVYQESIAPRLADKYEIFYYRVSRTQKYPGQREYVVTNDRHRVLDRVLTPDFDVINTLTEPLAEQAFARVLAKFEIDLIHYHHLINHVVSLPLISKMMGVPSVYTTQDFFLVCTRFNLVDYRGIYCNIAERPKVTCDVCLKAAEHKPAGAQAYRRSFMSRVLGSIDAIIANSPSARAVIGGVYPELEQRQAFVPLGLPLPKVGPVAFEPPVSTDGPGDRRRKPLRVVFLGNFTKIKGADVFLQVADTLRDEKIEFTICGRIDEPFPRILAELNLPNVKIHGGFEPGELDLSVFDMSLHLSIWPETYCITLSEAWKAGVVPIVTDCGALQDRVTNNVNAFTVPIDGAGELVSVLRRVAGDRGEITRILGNVGPDLWLTPDEHCEHLNAIYARVLGPWNSAPRERLSSAVDTGALLSIALTDEPINVPRWDDPALSTNDALVMAPIRPLNSLWAERRLIAARLAAGAYTHVGDATVWLDEFGPGIVSVGRGGSVTQIPASATIQLTGWIRMPAGVLDNKMVLALRSLNGDLILARLFWVDRPDVAATADQGVQSTGFVSEPIAQSMFDTGVYAVEVIRHDGDELMILACNAAVTGGETTAITTGYHLRGHPIVVVTPIERFRTPVASSKAKLMGSVDGVFIERTGNKGPWVIAAHGWTLDPQADQRAEVSVVLSGARFYAAPLRSMQRPDVEVTVAPIKATNAGYAGAAWLADVPPGQYRVSFVRKAASGVSIIATDYLLIIDASGEPTLEDSKLAAQAKAAVSAKES